MPDTSESTAVPARLRIPRQRGQKPNADPSGPVLREHIDAMIDLHPGGLTWRRAFPGTLDQIPHTRHFTRYLLADSDHRHDAELIAGELAANAVRHTASGRPHGTFIVEIARTTTTITIAVYDCGWGGLPRFGRLFGIDAEYGRGLAIVAALADQVGYEGNQEVGHRVWARMIQPGGRSQPCLPEDTAGETEGEQRGRILDDYLADYERRKGPLPEQDRARQIFDRLFADHAGYG